MKYFWAKKKTSSTGNIVTSAAAMSSVHCVPNSSWNPRRSPQRKPTRTWRQAIRAVAIAQITVTDLQHIYEARITLESAAARLATTRITPSVLSQLERATTSLADGPPEVNPIELVRTDFVFHRILGKASGNAYLYDCIRRILGPAMRLTFLAYKHGQPSRNSYDEHLAIVRALSQRDPDAAEQAARYHIQMAKDRTLGRL